MAGLLESFIAGGEAGRRARESREARADEQQLRGLTPQIIAGDPQAFSTAASIDPRRAMAAQGAGDDQLRRLKGAITYLDGISKQFEADPAKRDQALEAAYQGSVRPYLARYAPQGVEPPSTYAESLPKLEEARARIATLEDVGKQGRVQSTRVGDDGFIYTVMADGTIANTGVKAQAPTQILEAQGGFYNANKATGQATPVTFGGAPQPGPQTSFSGADGTTVQIDPSLPAEVQAAIRANEGAWANAPDNSVANITGNQPRTISAVTPQILQPAGKERESFAPLNSDEVAAMGLPAGTFVQRNTQTGKLDFGPAAVQPKQQDPAKLQKLRDQKRKEQAAATAFNASLDQSIRLIDDIIRDPSKLRGVTGLGSLGSAIPGTAWADIAAKLDTLKARSAFGALQEMRANSPTGGALGSVSERELYLLQNAETQLQNSQSPESLLQSLRDYKSTLNAAKGRIRSGVDEFYNEQEQASTTVPSAPAGWSIQRVQ